MSLQCLAISIYFNCAIFLYLFIGNKLFMRSSGCTAQGYFFQQVKNLPGIATLLAKPFQQVMKFKKFLIWLNFH